MEGGPLKHTAPSFHSEMNSLTHKNPWVYTLAYENACMVLSLGYKNIYFISSQARHETIEHFFLLWLPNANGGDRRMEVVVVFFPSYSFNTSCKLDSHLEGKKKKKKYSFLLIIVHAKFHSSTSSTDLAWGQHWSRETCSSLVQRGSCFLSCCKSLAYIR